MRTPAGPGIEFLDYLTPTDGRPLPGGTTADDLWGEVVVMRAAIRGSNTPMLRDPKRANLAIMPLPFGRLIEPDEIAALIEFLLGPYAGAITGQMIYVCGGSSIPGLPAPPKV